MCGIYFNIIINIMPMPLSAARILAATLSYCRLWRMCTLPPLRNPAGLVAEANEHV